MRGQGKISSVGLGGPPSYQLLHSRSAGVGLIYTSPILALLPPIPFLPQAALGALGSLLSLAHKLPLRENRPPKNEATARKEPLCRQAPKEN